MVDSLMQDMDEMSQALGMVIGTIDESDSFITDPVPGRSSVSGADPAIQGPSPLSTGSRSSARVNALKPTAQRTDTSVEASQVTPPWASKTSRSRGQEDSEDSEGGAWHSNTDDNKPGHQTAADPPACTSGQPPVESSPHVGNYKHSANGVAVGGRTGTDGIAGPVAASSRRPSVSGVARSETRPRAVQARIKEMTSPSTAPEISAAGGSSLCFFFVNCRKCAWPTSCHRAVNTVLSVRNLCTRGADHSCPDELWQACYAHRDIRSGHISTSDSVSLPVSEVPRDAAISFCMLICSQACTCTICEPLSGRESGTYLVHAQT